MFLRRASKLLKSEAATALRHLTLTTFTRAEVIFEESNNAESSRRDSSSDKNVTPTYHRNQWESASTAYTISQAYGVTLLLGKISSVLSTNIDPNVESKANVQFFLSLLNVALEAGGPALGSMEIVVEVLRGDICRHLLHFSQSGDLAVFSLTLRVVFNLFMSIKNHMKVQLEVFFTSVYLNILQSSSSPTLMSSGLQAAREELALESLLEFCREPSLMHDIYSNYDCDVQCTNLFDSIITVLCRRAIPSGRHSVTIVNPGLNSSTQCNQPEVQVLDGSDKSASYVNILNRLSLEGILSILHAVAVRCSQLKPQNVPKLSSKRPIVSQNSIDTNLNVGSKNSVVRTNAQEVSDVDAWCLRSEDEDEDGFTLLPTNTADCQHDDNDAAHSVNKPTGSTSIAVQDKSSFLTISSIHALRSESAATILRQRKLQKQRILSAVEKFNTMPLKPDWVRHAAELQLLPTIPHGAISTKGGAGEGLCDARSIAIFLKDTPGLGKRQVGEYISKGPNDKYPFHAEVLTEYCKTFVFPVEATFVEGFRQFLGHFHLPGEAQCIDRIMEAFAGRIFEHLGVGKPFVSADAAFILSFSTIMLNTDLHNTGIPVDKKMTLDQFLRNNRGINGGEDLPRDFLEKLYNEIKEKQIMVDNSMTAPGASQINYSDTASWQKLLFQSQSSQAPASFTPTIAARRSVSGDVDLDKMQFQYKTSLGHSGSRPQLNGVELNGYVTDDSTSKESETRDETDYDAYMHLFFPPSAHEKDMFLVMATNVLDVVLEVWQTTQDDILMCKTLDGLLDYAKICSNLNMSDHLDKMIQLMAAFVLQTLQKADNISSVSESLSKNGKFESMYDADKGCYLDVVLGLDFNDLFQAGVFRKQFIRRGAQDSNRKSYVTKQSVTESQQGNFDHASNRSKKDSGANCLSDTCEPKCLHIYRGYILLRLLFFIGNEYVCHIRKGGWLAISTLLLWARKQNALPADMLDIFDFTSGRGTAFSPSPYADKMRKKDFRLVSNENRKIMEALQEQHENSSVWASVTSLGGLLWQSEGSSPTSLDAAGTAVQGDIIAPTQSHHGNIQSLLRNALQHSPLQSLLFTSVKQLSARSLDSMVWSLLSSALADRHYIQRVICEPEPIHTVGFQEGLHMQSIKGLQNSQDFEERCSGVYVGRHQKRVWDFFKFRTEEISIADAVESDHIVVCRGIDVVEGDAVHVLEWVRRILCADNSHSLIFPASLSKFLKAILLLEGENLSSTCPYLLERAMVVILSVANTFQQIPSTKNTISSFGFHLNNYSESVWDSFRLIKDIPHAIIFYTADRLGAGLLRFVKSCTAEYGQIDTIDKWFLLFSLLSTATVGSLGRPYVWETICFLVDNNHINTLNFTPCRNLVFRFLYRVFPSDDEDFSGGEVRKNYQQPESKELNPWLTGALLYQMRLTLMALGGYSLATARATAAHNEAIRKAEFIYSAKNSDHNATLSGAHVDSKSFSSRSTSRVNEDDDKCKYMQFPLPVDDMSLSYNVALSSTNDSEERKGDDISAGQHKFSSSPLTPTTSSSRSSTFLGSPSTSLPNIPSVIKVRCVEFSKIDDVELLWLESVKTFSDYVNTHPVEISKNSSFCLKTVIYGAQVAEIPRKCWLEALTEMLSRLPLHAEKTISSFESQQLKQIQSEQKELAKMRAAEDSGHSSFSLFSLGSSSLRSLPMVTTLSSSKLATLTAEGFEICLQCSVIVFDTLVFHFKLLRSYEEFRPFWIKYVSILAHNVVYSNRGSLIHDESVDMIGSLFRLLYQPDIPQHCYSPLLRMSWTAVNAICPSIPGLLEVNHPNIVGLMLKHQADYEESNMSSTNAPVTIAPAVAKLATPKIATMTNIVDTACVESAVQVERSRPTPTTSFIIDSASAAIQMPTTDSNLSDNEVDLNCNTGPSSLSNVPVTSSIVDAPIQSHRRLAENNDVPIRISSPVSEPPGNSPNPSEMSVKTTEQPPGNSPNPSEMSVKTTEQPPSPALQTVLCRPNVAVSKPKAISQPLPPKRFVSRNQIV